MNTRKKLGLLAIPVLIVLAGGVVAVQAAPNDSQPAPASSARQTAPSPAAGAEANDANESAADQNEQKGTEAADPAEAPGTPEANGGTDSNSGGGGTGDHQFEGQE